MVLRDGRLQVGETPDPKPGPGELLLRTLSTAICASDVHFMDHPELAVDDPTGRSLYDTNRDIVLGHEFVGEVIGRDMLVHEGWDFDARRSLRVGDDDDSCHGRLSLSGGGAYAVQCPDASRAPDASLLVAA